MNTLEQLNNYGSTTISYTDNRPYGVIFNKSIYSNLDSTATLTNKTITVAPPIDIEEIIDATNAQVEYEIELPTSDATISWGTLPAGVTLYTIGNRYILRYLSSINDWEAVKDPTITVGDDFFGNFFYTIRIKYRTPDGQQTVRCIIGGELPQMYLSSVATISPDGDRVRLGVANLIGFGSIATIAEALEIVYYEAALSSAFSATIEATLIPPIRTSAVLTTAATISAEAEKVREAQANLNVLADVDCIPTVIPSFFLSLDYTKTGLGTQKGADCTETYSFFGTNSESVRQYTNSTGSLTRTLSRPNANYDGFGYYITADSSLVSISSYDGSSQGAVYQFNQSTGSLVNTLESPDTNNDAFGWKNDASDDYTIVGTFNTGKAYVFDNTDGSLEYTINLGATADRISVSISDNYFILGDEENQEAKIYNISDGSLLRTISAPSGTSEFGANVCLVENSLGNYAIIADTDYNNGNASSGRVYIYNVNNGSLLHTLTNPDEDGTSFGDQFGTKLRADSIYLMVGTPFEDVTGGPTDNNRQGAVYTYKITDGNKIETVTSPDSDNLEGFGWGIGMSPTYAVVMDQQSGEGYIYEVT
jgi:hypothetical protein